MPNRPTRDPRPEAPPQWRLILSFGTLYIIWGTTYLAIRFAVETLPPFLMGAGRFLIGGIALYALMRFRGAPRPRLIHWRSALIIGACLMLVGQGGVAWAEQRISSGLAAVLVATMPIWITLLNWIRPRGDRPDLRMIVGLIAGFGGVVLLVAPWQSGAGSVDTWGVLAVILATFAWAIGSLYTRTASLPPSHLLATAMEMLAGGVLLLIAGTARGEWAHVAAGSVSLRSVLSLAYLIVFGSLIALTTYVWLLSVCPPSRVATYAYVNPVVAVFLGWLLAGEVFSVRMLLAAAVILGAVVLVTTGRTRPRRRLSTKPRSAGPG
ncbi:MAG: EamA family transporter [Actinobacteria bacterium]|nr:EamA family transporter [Actinomycetota bacterium]